MPKNGTIAYIHTMPKCDFPHGSDVTPNPDAEYDFKTALGPWAYGCKAHYKTYRFYPDLGTGKGQKLEVRTDD